MADNITWPYTDEYSDFYVFGIWRNVVSSRLCDIVRLSHGNGVSGNMIIGSKSVAIRKCL